MKKNYIKNEKMKDELINSLLAAILKENMKVTNSSVQNAINEVLIALERNNAEAVTEYIRYPKSVTGFCQSFDVCPLCNAVLSRSYQEYCSVCGQKLKWIARNKMKLRAPKQ